MHCTSIFYGNDQIGVGEIFFLAFRTNSELEISYASVISRHTEKYPNKKIKNDNNVSDGHWQPLQNSGITLIALIITIILLLILAGVAIHFTLGENGILRNTEISGEKYEEANAKEQLTLELANIQTKKYKETGKKTTLEDVKNLINKNKYDVDIEEGSTSAQIEDMENEYTFIVDENLTIQDVEKTTNQDKTIKIETSATNKSDFTTSTLKAKITLAEEIASIKIGEEEIELPEKTIEDGKNIYEIEKEVGTNGIYKVKVETVTGRTNSKIQAVSNLSEDMEIYTANDLVRFRNRVEKGATYEGRTITVMNDIDLSSVCGRNVNGKEVNWDPIGYYHTREDNCYFNGTFNGQYKTISNLYINIDENNAEKYDVENDYTYAGLFGWSEGTIQNLIIENVYIYVDISTYSVADKQHQSIGALAGESAGNLTNIGIKSGSITSINTANLSVTNRGQYVGGITGSACGEGYINNCYNNANILVTNSNDIASGVNPYSEVGGIAGESNKCIITNCFNSGNVKSDNAKSNYVGGLVGRIVSKESPIENSYNYGEISGEGSNSKSDFIAGIVGQNGYTSSTKGTITNSYCTDTSATYASYLYDASHYTTGRVTESTLKGYTSKLNKEENEKGVWVNDTGINNGYPILKWQVEHQAK